MTAARIPGATYRLQFHAGFGFAKAAAIVPYLQRLGITDLYASPLFKACAGSTHGYDSVDPTVLNPELGDQASFALLVDALRSRNMGLLLDIVPNHVAASSENMWWRDVLMHGRASPFAPFFDINWEAGDGQVILPVLGKSADEAIEAGELQLMLDDDDVSIRYYENAYPIDPGTLDIVLHQASHASLRSIVPHIEAMPARDSIDQDELAHRYELSLRVRQMLAESLRKPECRDELNRIIATINNNQADSNAQLLSIVKRQPYRLMYWHDGAKIVNYRRFFDITDLIGVRQEYPPAFVATHTLVRQLVGDQSVTGLRVDHIDGLRDPLGYLHALQSYCNKKDAASESADTRTLGCYVIVEKILTGSEQLRTDWPIFGTTGYEQLNAINRVFIDPTGQIELTNHWKRFCSISEDFDAVAATCKRTVLRELFQSDMKMLAAEFMQLARNLNDQVIFTEEDCRDAIIELTVAMPVYRTYLQSANPSDVDRAVLEQAFATAQPRCPQRIKQALDMLRELLLTEQWPAPQRNAIKAFILNWQQRTGPATAKGIEDTALYRYTPLASLCEVGGEPTVIEHAVNAFHHFNAERARHWPHALSATSTHDTKRSEDARARLNVLSEMPERWRECVERWSKLNKRFRHAASGSPTLQEEHLLYQMLLAVWPLDRQIDEMFAQRIERFMIKAAREAKLHTSWIDVNDSHEQHLREFIAGILDPSISAAFLHDLLELESILSPCGAVNSLSQVVLKVASPGVADFYQGSETWHLALVDPDNRQPVDFAALDQSLRIIETAWRSHGRTILAELLNTWRDGRIKMFTTWRLLQARQAHRELFERSEYLPLHIEGEMRNHALAFARITDSHHWAVAVVPRLVSTLLALPSIGINPQQWRDTCIELPSHAPANFTNVLSDETITRSSGSSNTLVLRDVLSVLPVALLIGPSEERPLTRQ